MTNLYEETISVLKENGKSLEEVVWIGSEDGYISKDLFLSLANVKYNAGFGAAEVAEDLVISGSSWWLERAEYDGSEWWEFKTTPTKPANEIKPIRLTGGIWTKLIAMENEDNYD